MDQPTDQPTGVTVQTVPAAPSSTRPARRRRPSGEPPPLPRHLKTSGVGWLVAAVVLVAAATLTFAGGLRGVAVEVTVLDDAVVRWLRSLDTPGLTGLFRALGALASWWVLNSVSPALIVTLIVLRRFRHLIIWLVVATVLQTVASDLLGPAMQRPRPFGVVFGAGWGGWAMPSLQLTLFTGGLVAILYSLVPEGRWRGIGKWIATGVVALVGLSRVALGIDAPSDVLLAAVLGVTVPLLAFRWFAPNEVFPVTYRRGRSAHLDVGGARGDAIERALRDQLGVIVEDVRPFGLAGSAGSTPLRIKVKAEPPRVLFGKLYAKSHLQSDRWYKLGRELMYGRLEDEKPFNTVRRLVQQEDYALSLMQRAALPSPTPYGFVELTPEREYLLVTEFFDGAVELGEAEVDDEIIDDGLRIVRRLWDAGLAHRDIKPANLLVRDGRLLLIDVAFTEARPSPWRQAVDLANMMLCLALRTDPDRVYQRALRQFTVEEITEGFAAARGLALPSQLRRMMRAEGRDLHAGFCALLPRQPQPISIQLWSVRRVVLLGCAVIVLMLTLGVVVGGAVDNSLATRTPLNVGALPCDDPEPMWLIAQAVPTAAQVPCVRSLPAGWTLATVSANSGRSVLTLDHDRAGTGALMAEFTAGCDPGDAGEVGTDQPDVRRYQRVDATTSHVTTARYDVFPGGCLAIRLLSPPEHNAQLTAEMSLLLGFTSRRSLELVLEERSDGRLRLDPAVPR
jgi:membrane-associated phospholipid phosphatase/tRNA A-37 threonylcarbamoyl transferase component Bud32